MKSIFGPAIAAEQPVGAGALAAGEMQTGGCRRSAARLSTLRRASAAEKSQGRAGRTSEVISAPSIAHDRHDRARTRPIEGARMRDE
jgi:hypothetical protein